MKRKLGFALALAMLVGCFSLAADVALPGGDARDSYLDEEGMHVINPNENRASELAAALAKADALHKLGLFQGTDSGYALEQGVTRAQAVTMALRFVGVMTMEYRSAADTFDDVAPDHWADGTIGKAVSLGIAKGVGARAFAPERTVTAREFITFLLRAVGYPEAAPETCLTLASDCGMLRPDTLPDAEAAFTRGHMVAICWQALDAARPDGVTVRAALGLMPVEPAVSAEYNLDLALLRAVAADDEAAGKNVMFSPLSIKLAFLMAANGAGGGARAEILSALGVDDLDAYNETARQLIDGAPGGEDATLRIANSIWLNTDFYPAANVKFADAYGRIVREFYGGAAREVNNRNAVETVNGWIAAQTNDRITNVLSDPEFLTALVNTIYFKANWHHPFKEAATAKGDFTDRNQTVGKLDFMEQTAYFAYYEDATLQMLGMPYKGANMSMYVFLPKGDAELTAADLRAAMDGKAYQEVHVKFPKFRTEFSVTLNDVMKELGVVRAFDDDCMDFRDVMLDGVPPRASVYVDKVLHKSFLEVDENGTEAAAATVILMVGTTGMPAPKPEPKQFVADHPFLYMIRDDTSGEVLFLGQYDYLDGAG